MIGESTHTAWMHDQETKSAELSLTTTPTEMSMSARLRITFAALQ